MEWAAAVTGLVVSGGLGWFAPRVIARIPEPEASPTAEAVPEPTPGPEPLTEPSTEPEAPASGRRSRGLGEAPPKEAYADIAAAPGLALRLAGWSGLVGAALGLALGWTGALVPVLPLVPVGAGLFLVDWRTTLLPTRVIHPTYAVLAVLVPLAALLDHDLGSLLRAGWGWLLLGGWFWLFWAVAGAWGFGDVRLARVLGPVLGYLGWAQLAVGGFAMVLLGGVGGAVLAARNRSLRRRFPYGPFMLLGAVVGATVGPQVARGLGY